MLTKKRIFSAFLALSLVLGLMMPLPAQAAGTAVEACLIQAGSTDQVEVRVQAESGLSSADGKLYLFAVPTYAEGIAGYAPIASQALSGAGTYRFQVALGQGTQNCLLYSKFYAAVRTGSGYSPVTGGNFITNPELISPAGAPRTVTASKKGVHLNLYIPTDALEMGLEQGFFNIVYQDFISNTPTELSYQYNGKTYYFTDLVYDYDNLISHMTDAGIAVTVALLNRYRAGYEYMIHPAATYRDGTFNYAVNVSTPQSLETLAAATHFLAQRYNGTDSGCGQVDNWIFGNEVNDNNQYYYMGPQDVGTFVKEYEKAFRVVYSAVKSGYANANVYICLQHRWAVADGTTDYSAKTFVDTFNALTTAQGNIDWGLSIHPYSYPMNDPEILNDGTPSLESDGSTTFGGEVTGEVTTPLITMKNLQVLTDYFRSSSLRDRTGQVRSIILGEQGYTSYSNLYGKNEARQAANIALSYYIAEMNPDVDAYLLRGHIDEIEGSEYYRFGLRNMTDTGAPAQGKFAYDIFKYLDTADSLAVTEFAKAALNIADWSSVVPGWNASRFSSMGTVTETALQTVSSSSGTVVAQGMQGHWQPGYNVFDVGNFDYTYAHYPQGLAVANNFANPLEFQSVKASFSSPKNLGSYLTIAANFKPKTSGVGPQKLEAKLRLRSGSDTLVATGILEVGKDYTLCVDLTQWAGRRAVDSVELLIRDLNQAASFDGTFTLYQTTAATSVKGLQSLQSTAKTFRDLSGATLRHQTSFNYTGSAIEPQVSVTLDGKTLVQRQDYDVIFHDNVATGTAKVVIVGIGSYSGYLTSEFTIQNDFPTILNGIDYSPVYAYSYYLDNNSAVAQEVGTDPQAVLEHFVNKGMDYALQAIGDFNVLAYAKINDDLQRRFGEDWKAYYLHYLEFGISENRSTSGLKPSDMEGPYYPGNGPSDTPVAPPSEQPPVEIPEPPANGVTTPMYRLYNPNSGEHFYTGSAQEARNLVDAGWIYEGISWNAPIHGGSPVYRLYNPNSGDHHYTMSPEERDMLVGVGWIYEGVAWNSADPDGKYAMVLYRLYNPNADCGSHHYTGSQEERDMLVGVGWIYEGVGWFGLTQ